METHLRDGYPKYLPDDLEAFISDGSALRAWVAELDGRIVGHAALHPRSADVVMDMAVSATGMPEHQLVVLARLLVSPSARGLGLGRALVQKAQEEAAAMGRRPVLDVVEEQRDAIALYERCGWSRVGEVKWNLPDGRPLREFVYIAPPPPAVTGL